MKPVILITEKEFYKAEEQFSLNTIFLCKPAPLEEDRLVKAVVDADAFAVIVGVDAYRNGLYAALPRGGVIARFGVGHDGIDKAKATAHGLLATNTPGVLDDSVAEHAVLMMGGFARRLPICHDTMKNGRWTPTVGSELFGKTLLVVGCGSIGCKTAKIAAFGFGMRVIGYDVSPLDADALQCNYGIQTLVTDLDAALAQADYVSLHIPSTSATYHWVDAAFLAKLKPSCVLINTARGPVIDEGALYDALAAGRIAGAALDVYENEPFVPVHPCKDLRTLSNVLLTPHVGSSTVEACRRMALSCLANIQAAYEKRYSNLNLLNPDVLNSLIGDRSYICHR